MPLDNVASKLRAIDDEITDILEEQYDPRFLPVYSRHGKTTNMILPMSEEGDARVDGDGLNIRFRTRNGDNFRGSGDIFNAFPTPRNFRARNIKIRFQDNPANNDFMDISGSAKTTDYDIRTGGKGALVDVADEIVNQLMEDYAEKLAIYRNIPKSGQLAIVSGTPKQNDKQSFAAAAATATNATGARFKITGGSISYFPAGVHLDVYRGGTLIASNVETMEPNYVDESVSVRFNTGSDDPSGGLLGNIADGDQVFFSGGKGGGMYSLGEWFRDPAAGDPFIGGVDRTVAGDRHLLPIFLRDGATDVVKISASHLRQASIASRFRKDDSKTVAIRADPKITASLTDDLDAKLIVTQSPAGGNTRRNELGAMGVSYQSFEFGRAEIVSDPLIRQGEVQITVAEDWRSYTWGERGLRRMPGLVGNWHLLPSGIPAGGGGSAQSPSRVWGQYAYATNCDFCSDPQGQVVILKVKG